MARSRKARTSSRRRSRNNSSRRRSRKSSSRRRSRKSRGGGKRLKSFGTGLKKKVGMDKVTNCKNLTKKVKSYATIDEYCTKNKILGDCFNDTSSKLKNCKTTLAEAQASASAKNKWKKVANVKNAVVKFNILKKCAECKKFMRMVFENLKNPKITKADLQAIQKRGICVFKERKRIYNVFKKNNVCIDSCIRYRTCVDRAREVSRGATRARQAATRGAAGVGNLVKGEYTTVGRMAQAVLPEMEGYDDSGAVERISLKTKGINDKQIEDAINVTKQSFSASSKGGKSRRRSSRKSSKRSSRRRSSRKSSKRSSRRRSRKSRR